MYVHCMYNQDMKFEWDEQKAKINVLKHHISFEEAATVFYDPMAKITYDPDHSNIENRFILVGHSQKSRLLVVIHLVKDEQNIIRIISARKATKKEKREFEEI